LVGTLSATLQSRLSKAAGSDLSTDAYCSTAYVQADESGNLDAGMSNATNEYLGDGRLRMIEHFQRATRPTSGADIFEQVR
jgi:hypothetical protein